MKKLLVGLVVLLSPSLLIAGIHGSRHDFRNYAWSNNRKCVPCHTSHIRSSVGSNDASVPLWNRSDTNTSYIVYSSATLQADDVAQPGGMSKFCLSCHDGGTYLDAFGGQTGSVDLGDIPAGSNYKLGTDLNNHHPISFEYNTALFVKSLGSTYPLKDPLSELSGLGSTIDEDLLQNHRVVCISCHNAHNDDGNLRNLKNNSVSSNWCEICHAFPIPPDPWTK